MKCKQVLLREVEGGAMTVAWIDAEHDMRRNIVLDLGDGERSPIVEIVQVWDLEVKDMDAIRQQEHNRRAFGGSIQ